MGRPPDPALPGRTAPAGGPEDDWALQTALERLDLALPAEWERRAVLTGADPALVAGGADTYVLARVVERCDDDAAAALLRACRRGLRPPGRLILLEAAVRVGGDTVALGSPVTRERTLGEFGALLCRAGFAMSRVGALTYGVSFVEAHPYA